MRKAAGVLPAGSIRAEYITSLHGNVTVKNGKAEARVRWATFFPNSVICPFNLNQNVFSNIYIAGAEANPPSKTFVASGP